MALTIVTTPDACATAHNPIVLIINSDAVGLVEVEVVLRVRDFNSIDEEELIALREQVDADGNATFYLERYIRDALSYQLPDPTVDTAQALLQGARVFPFDYIEVIDGMAGFNASDAGFVSALAGWAFWLFPDKATLLPNNFLASLKPSVRYLNPILPDWVYMYAPYYANFGGAVFIVLYTIYYTDATNDTINETYPAGALDDDIQQYQLIAVPIGFPQKQYDTLNPAKTIERVEVDLTGYATIILYPQETEPWQQRQLFYFSKTTGGLESVLLNGEQSETNKIERTTSQRFVPTGYAKSFAQNKVDYAVGKRNFKVHTGLMDQLTFLAVQELIEAESAFIWQDDTFVAINILSDSKELPSDNDTLHGFEIQYEYAHLTTGRP